MNARITQKEIARRLGLSQALVSRALGGSSAAIGAADATVARIRAAAAAWAYQPSAAALSLRGASSRTLGVAVRDFNDPFFGQLTGELHRLARAQGYALLLTGWDAARAAPDEVAALSHYRLDGLVLCGSDFGARGAAAFRREGRPVVQIGTGAPPAGAWQVRIDEAAGLDAVLRLLVGLGHAGVGFLGDGSAAHRRRGRILADCMRSRGLAVRREWFVHVTAAGDRRTPVTPLLARDRRAQPTAVVAGDDVLAQAVLRRLHEAGCRVPDDLSLAGWDDIPAARLGVPALTTVQQPIARLVQTAFGLVTGGAGPKDRDAGVIRVAPELVVRESCGPAPGAPGRGRTDTRTISYV